MFIVKRILCECNTLHEARVFPYRKLKFVRLYTTSEVAENGFLSAITTKASVGNSAVK
jgi:hypothetical protein